MIYMVCYVKMVYEWTESSVDGTGICVAGEVYADDSSNTVTCYVDDVSAVGKWVKCWICCTDI